jgi:phosphatidylglycerophosphate synthase
VGAAFSWEVLWAAAILVLTLAGAAAYLLRVSRKGRARFERVDRQGGTALLGKTVMEGAYWLMQPTGRFLVARGVTPNQISWCSLVLGCLAGASLASGRFGLGAALAIGSGLLDAFDGMVARLGGTATPGGEVLDSSIDRYAEFFFLGGLVLHWRPHAWAQALALLALAGSFMVSYSTAKAEAMGLSVQQRLMKRPERALYLNLGAVASVFSIEWFESPLEGVRSALGWPMVVAVALVAVLANFSAVVRLREVALRADGRTR